MEGGFGDRVEADGGIAAGGSGRKFGGITHGKLGCVADGYQRGPGSIPRLVI